MSAQEEPAKQVNHFEEFLTMVNKKTAETFPIFKLNPNKPLKELVALNKDTLNETPADQSPKGQQQDGEL